MEHELPHKLPNGLRVKILGNYEILEKCQIWVETQASAQSPLQKLNFENSCQQTGKIRSQLFEVLSNFTGFLYFVPNIFPRIVASDFEVSDTSDGSGGEGKSLVILIGIVTGYFTFLEDF